jgi:hypothetical protein
MTHHDLAISVKKAFGNLYRKKCVLTAVEIKKRLATEGQTYENH